MTSSHFKTKTTIKFTTYSYTYFLVKKIYAFVSLFRVSNTILKIFSEFHLKTVKKAYGQKHAVFKTNPISAGTNTKHLNVITTNKIIHEIYVYSVL